MITLLIGYAIGTLQILAVEWIRRITRHRGDLRVLRAELRRAASYDGRFALDDAGSLDKETVPRPPRVSPRFADFVTQTAFHLTDKYRDAVTQEALLAILDSCAMFQETLDRFEKLVHELRDAEVPDHAALIADLRGTARDYDRRLDVFRPIVQNVINDIDERLQEASVWRQLNRRLGELPAAPVEARRELARAT